MKSFRVVVTLLAISFLLPSMAASNYEKAVYHQNKAEQAYKYSLVSMMKAHIDSMWQEIYEMDWDSYDKNRERLDRGYYKLCGDYYYLTDNLDRALYYYNLAQPLFKRYEGAGYYGIIHEEKAQLFYKKKDWEKAKSYADPLKKVSFAAPIALNWNFCTDDDGDLWFLEVRYHLGLTKMNKDVMFTNGWRTPGSIRNSIVMLTIGYKCDL